MRASDNGIPHWGGGNRMQDVGIVVGALAKGASEEDTEWRELTLETLRKRNFEPVSDWGGECCFVGLRRDHMQRLHWQGGQRGSTPAEAQAFLARCGARTTSQDVRWPVTLALRWSTDVRGSGLRRRTAEGQIKRVQKKIARGILPPGFTVPTHVTDAALVTDAAAASTHCPER